MMGCGDCGVLFRTCSSISEEFAIYYLRVSKTVLPFSSSICLTCGTHFGDTNEPASIVRSPVCASLFTNSIFVATGIDCFSFCNPSRGPTSTMRT